jgi:hypothetical protein
MMVALNLPSFMDFYKSPIVFLFLAHVAIAFPIDPSEVPWSKRSPGEFNHPGLWHSHDDLERMRTNVIKGNDPWKSAFEKFSIDKYSLANYTMQGPKTVLVRGTGSNYSSFTQDVRAAWQNAIMCKSHVVHRARAL